MSAKTLQKGSSNLGKKPMVFVFVCSATYLTLMVLAFGALQNYIMGVGLGWLGVAGITVAFQCGARQLVSVTSKAAAKPSAGTLRIKNTARRILMLFGVFTLGMFSCKCYHDTAPIHARKIFCILFVHVLNTVYFNCRGSCSLLVPATGVLQMHQYLS